jgi:ribonucleoside-triphosphate reductase (thioredoxin)
MTIYSNLSFRLNSEFLDGFKNRQVDWGFKDAAGNSFSEIVFLRTYSRLKEDGTKEKWWEVCQRVIEGMFSIQKDHCKSHRIPWNDHKAQRTAQDAFERLFSFKWTPPGRGLWMMGTPLVNEKKNSAALQNCAYVSTGDMTKYDPTAPFTFLMEASMLGIGVGFDTKGADKNFTIYQPGNKLSDPIVIADSREGWVDSVRALLESYLLPNHARPVFDYSLVRSAGVPIKTFGGTAAGPEPLIKLHNSLTKVLDAQIGNTLNSRTIADIGNLIGVCVVSGNVRRSAELLLGSIDDDDFLALKDYSGAGADRAEWSWMSNNSVVVNVGDDLSKVINGIAQNGEPGVVWMDTSRKYGRLADPMNNKDHRAAGYNPCAEQTLESFECCTLVETFLNRHDNLADYKRTLKVAYLYAKTVTLMATHWERTNAIMLRNRRIGASMSGIANFADNYGLPTLREWMDQGYQEVQRLDHKYSEWLCVRESIKTTTVKPSGTVSILAGESPGVHWSPGGEYFNRAIRFSKDDPMVQKFQRSGYTVEDAQENPDTTVVVYFPIHSKAKRSEADVTLFEKAALAANAQRWWSDNSVSVTLSFNPEKESDHVGAILGMYEGQLKTVSFLPMGGVYAQMPYTNIEASEYKTAELRLWPVDLESIYNGGADDAEGEAYCSTDVCMIKSEINVT